MTDLAASTPAIPGSPSIDAVRAAFGRDALGLEPMGSRVTCDPAPTGTDEDWLMLVRGDPQPRMAALGMDQDGSPEFYTGTDAGGFRSWRSGDLNVVTTRDEEFFNRFMTATHLARRFNLLVKADRIALFQAVLYGVRAANLEERPQAQPIGEDRRTS